MPTYMLLSPTAELGNDPSNPVGVVAVPGNPSRATYTLSMTGPPNAYCQATVVASVDGVNYDFLLVLRVDPPNTSNIQTISSANFANYVFYDALLNNITPGGNLATVTMVV